MSEIDTEVEAQVAEEVGVEVEVTAPEEVKEAPKEPYVPPKCAFALKDFIKASKKALKAHQVDCPACPVYLLCSESQGGTGYVCGKCGSTGVWIDKPDYGRAIPTDILVLDCDKHKFERDEKRKLSCCVLCSGGLAQLEVNERGAKNHLVFTVHSKVKIENRQTVLKEAWKKWTDYFKAEAKKNKKAHGKN